MIMVDLGGRGGQFSEAKIIGQLKIVDVEVEFLRDHRLAAVRADINRAIRFLISHAQFGFGPLDLNHCLG